MDSTKRKQLVEALISYGLNEYEAKAYLALLQYGPAVAGEISRRSGIPRPRVYDTLQRLIDASLVTECGGSPKSYAPLDLSDFLREKSSEFRRRQDLLKTSLDRISVEDQKVGIFHVHDEARILQQCEDLIDAAEGRLLLLVTNVDLQKISGRIQKSVARGVAVHGVVCGPTEFEFGLAGRPLAESQTLEGCRRLIICRDGREMIVGHLGGGDRPYAIKTRNALLIEEFIRTVNQRVNPPARESEFTRIVNS